MVLSFSGQQRPGGQRPGGCRQRLGLQALEQRDVPATFTVTSLLDDGSPGTLRDAINQANTNPGNDTIVFNANVTGTIVLNGTELTVNDPSGGQLTINGPGANLLSISGNNTSRVIRADSDLEIIGLTMRDGNSSFAIGGGILSVAMLTIRDSVITENRASIGGGIFSGAYFGPNIGLVLINSTVSNNRAEQQGGGIFLFNNNADSTIQNSLITDNTAIGCSTARGGGVVFYQYIQSGDLLIDSSTIANNTASSTLTGYGGGVYIVIFNSIPGDPTFTAVNSTISNNTALTDGGGVYIDSSVNNNVRFFNSTIANNNATNGFGGGISNPVSGTGVILNSTIVANNTQGNAPPVFNDLSGQFNAEYSLIRAVGNATVNETVPGTVIYGVDPLLGPLTNNGGPTPTLALLAGSPAINAGNNPLSLTYDQRGAPFQRTIPTSNPLNTDIGAYEIQPPPPPPPPPTPGGVVPFVVGTGPDGGPHVRVLDPSTGNPILDFLAYDEAFQGGVNVAVGDVTGDGQPNIITAPATNGGSDIRIFDANTGQLIYNFLAYPGFYGGVYVATGDVDGDGIDDIITGAGRDGGPHVRVFKGGTFEPIRDFLAYAGNYFGGVAVAAADVNGDTIADIITGSATFSSHVQVFDGTNLQLLKSFIAYAPAYDRGITVAAADFNSDNLADIVTGSGTQSSNVRIFDSTNLNLLNSVIAYPGFDDGVRVGIAHVNGSVQVATGSGSKGGPHVRIFTDGISMNPDLDLIVYGIAFQGGVNVSG